MTNSPMYALVEMSLCDGVATLRLNDPPANTLSYDLVLQLERVFIRALLDPAVQVIALTGQGERFFSGGVNISMLCHATRHFNSNFVLYAAEVFNLIARSTKPVIAAINGHATGGGLELALLAQRRIAAEGSYNIGLPEVRLGVIPGLGGTQRLSRLVGVDKALDLIVHARFITPTEALDLGVVDTVVPLAALAQQVASVAQELVETCDSCDSGEAGDGVARDFSPCSDGVAVERVGRVGVISLSRAITRADDLPMLAALNDALLDLRKDENVNTLLIYVTAGEALAVQEESTPAVIRLLTEHVIRRIGNYPGLCTFYTDVPLDAFSARLARECDFRYMNKAHITVARDHYFDAHAALRAPSFTALAETNSRGWLIDQCMRFVPPLGASRALGYAKLAIKKGFHLPLEDAQFLERQIQEPLLSSPDGQQGMHAYMDKRAPTFKGE